MSLVVQKFGGSSVRDSAHLRSAMQIVKGVWEQGWDVVVVLSAQGDTTDELLSRARQAADEPPARELDALLATGETASAALGAMTLQTLGVPAVSLAGWQIPVHTDGQHGGAAITDIGVQRVQEALARRCVVVAAGFQGVDGAGDVTTLGRGGSDTSAVALAAFLHAERCVIYTDVDGVFTTDPRICPSARRLESVSYAHMLRLASSGAKVLHDRSVALAARYRVELEVRSCEKKSVGTRVVEHAEHADVTGVTRCDAPEGCVRITAVGSGLPSPAARRAVSEALSAAGIGHSGVEEGEESLHVTVQRQEADRALCLVHDSLFRQEV